MITRMANFIQTTKAQIFSIIFVSFYITGILLMTYKKHIIKEQMVHFEQPSTIARQLANEVEVGMHINSFPHFSIKDASFTIDCIVWFNFDKGIETIETLEDFTIKNIINLQEGKSFYKSSPIIKIVNNKVVLSYHVQATFLAHVAFNKFPISDHRINLYLENRTVSANELLFLIKKENITFSDELLLDTWNPVSVYTNSGIVNAQVGGATNDTNVSFPSIGISIDFENIGIRGLISLYLPLFILFFIGLLSLTIGIADPARLGIIGSSFPTLLLFRFVIDAVSPNISYITHIDFIYYILIILSFIILLFQTYIVLFIERAKKYSEKIQDYSKHRLEIFNNILFIVIIGALIVIMTYDFFH